MWPSIVTVLQESGDDECELVLRMLQPGASEQLLASAEHALGIVLPPQLRELLALANGQAYEESVSSFPAAPWTRLLPVADIIHTWERLDSYAEWCQEEWGGVDIVHDCVVAAGHRPGKDGSPILGLNSRWIPFAEAANGEGGAPVVFLLDCAPPAGVAAGRVLGFGGEGDALAIWAPDLLSMLQDILRVLQRRYGAQEEEEAAAPAAGPAARGGAGGAAAEGEEEEEEEEAEEDDEEEEEPQRHRRHFKMIFDDGPRIWYQYQDIDG